MLFSNFSLSLHKYKNHLLQYKIQVYMKVLKFGGTSVGSPDRIKKLLDIINPNEQ